MASEAWIWIRVQLKTLLSARRALKELSTRRHDEARLEDGPRRDQLRAEGDHLDAEAEQLRQAEVTGLTRQDGGKR